MWIVQFGLFTLVLVTVYFAWQINRPLHIPAKNYFILHPGQNASHLAQMLQDDDYFEQSLILTWTARVGGFERSLKAGEYQFEPEFSLLDILNHIVEGKFVTYSIQFIEGWTFKDFLAQLRTKENIVHTLSRVSAEEVLGELNLPIRHTEGWFFPDTYHYTSYQTDVSILKVAFRAMYSALEKEWAARTDDLPYKTAYESLIAASIIQKESNVLEEYPIIAGVIVNRLRKGMPLQMDPTVIYGLGGIDGALTRSHLKKDTAYNTYTRRGLPPTPIAMPGLAALRAAVRPAKTTALYFVARGDGSHAFSDTLKEHNIAVSRYRKLLKSKQ